MNRHERRKANSKAISIAYGLDATKNVYLSMAKDAVDFNAPDIENVLGAFAAACEVVDSFITSVECMVEVEDTIDRPLLLFTPSLVIFDEASGAAVSYVKSDAVQSEVFFAFELKDLRGETSHQIATRFLAVRNELMEHLVCIVLAMHLVEGGITGSATVQACAYHLEMIFELIGLPRKLAS